MRRRRLPKQSTALSSDVFGNALAVAGSGDNTCLQLPAHAYAHYHLGPKTCPPQRHLALSIQTSLVGIGNLSLALKCD